MSKKLQLRGGTTSEHGSFTGAVREVTVDTDKDTLVIHDGSTAGGFPLPRTNAEIRAAVEAATDSNVFTDSDHTKLNSVESSATADQTDAEIRAAVEAATDSNVFTDDDHTKLDGVAASANNYTHPTGAGNSHVPAGGSNGQVLSLSAYGAGGYAWVAQTTDTNTTYSAGTGMSLSGTTFNCNIDSPSEVGLGNLSSSGNNLSGNFTATGNITAYSDLRLKTDIKNIPDALNKVMLINGVTYERTDINTTRQTGVIAQEVQAVLPEAVFESSDGNLSVAYGQMIGLLIEAVKELKAKVDERQVI